MRRKVYYTLFTVIVKIFLKTIASFSLQGKIMVYPWKKSKKRLAFYFQFLYNIQWWTMKCFAK